MDSIENLIGTQYNDKLIGNIGDNVLEGGGGADLLIGGGGKDTVSYSGATSGVKVNLEAGFGAGGDAEGDLYKEISNIYGSDFNDTLIGNAIDNVISTGKGDDIAFGGDGNDLFIFGRKDGNDVIFGGSYAEHSNSWTDIIQLTDAASAPSTEINAYGDWLLHTNAAYIVTDHSLIFKGGDASGSVTFSDGNTIQFTDIDKIQWS